MVALNGLSGAHKTTGRVVLAKGVWLHGIDCIIEDKWFLKEMRAREKDAKETEIQRESALSLGSLAILEGTSTVVGREMIDILMCYVCMYGWMDG